MPPNQASAINVDPGVIRPTRRFRMAWLFWLLAIPASWWVLRTVPVEQIAAILVNLHGWQIFALMAINLGVIAVFSLRWWMLVGALGGSLPFFRAIGYHLAGFGVSYFTAGPQIGGEPLQVMLISQKHPVNLAAAVSSVFLDKVFQLLTSFTLLVFGSLWVFSRGILGNVPSAGLLVGVGVLLTLPLLHLLALRRGIYPLSQLIKRLPGWSWLERVINLTAQSEELISRLLQTNLKIVITAVVLSVGGWLLMFGEYVLMLRFIGGSFTTPQVFLAFLASQLAFLAPLPGGLGALEASQVMVITSFGSSAAIGLSVSLLIRARDVLFGLLGIFIAGNALHKRSVQPRAVPVQEE